MKKNFKLLARLVRMNVIDPEMFYSINVCNNEITLQGRFNAKYAMLLRRKVKFDTMITDNGFIQLSKGQIRIVFTD